MDPATGLRIEQVAQILSVAFLTEPPGWTRLEPQSISGDPTPGLEARVHDPLWLLARQWQLGEFQGEDVGTPIFVDVRTSVAPVVAFQAGDPAAHGHTDPWRAGALIEPLVEQEAAPPIGLPQGLGLRERADAGAQLVIELAEAGVDGSFLDRLVLACPLTLPWSDQYDHMAPALLRLLKGRVPDGEQAALQIEAAAAATPPRLPAWLRGAPDRAAVRGVVRRWHHWYRTSVAPEVDASRGCWIDDRLEYRFSVGVAGVDGQHVLRAPAFGGGRVDWWCLDHDPGAAPMPVAHPPAITSQTATLLATPLRFAGMPADRYWEFEDGAVNLGALQVQPHDLARLALVEFAMVYGNDWLLVPVDVDHGSFVTVDEVTYTTSFGESFTVPPAGSVLRSGEFRMFETTQVGNSDTLRGLFIPPAAPAVLEGEPYEEVMFVRDEMANMAWAVERVVEGPSGLPRNRSDEPPPKPFAPGTDVAADMDYQLENEIPDRWIPLVPVSTGYAAFSLRKGAMVKDGEAVEPLGVLLQPGRPVVFQDEEIPREGVRVRRVPALARRADGSYVRWLARRVDIGRGEAASGLAFDSAPLRRPQTTPSPRSAPAAEVQA
jgi:hypothetical protein